ncbi:MAG: cation:proton antiporter [Gaiellaceae bacterium]
MMRRFTTPPSCLPAVTGPNTDPIIESRRVNEARRRASIALQRRCPEADNSVSAMSKEALAAAAVLCVFAYLVGRLTRRHLPELVGYLVAGAVLGPTGVGVLERSQLIELRPLTLVAMAVLMFMIGERISLSSFRAAPWMAVVAPSSYLATAAVVFVAARAAGASAVLASLIAVFSGGGAPMTVAAIVGREPSESAYGRALIGLHASCDVIAAFAFAIVFPLADFAAGSDQAVSALLVEVLRLGVAGAAVGAVLGLSLTRISARLHDSRAVVATTVIHVAAAIAISWTFGFSVPLAALVLGAFVASSRSTRPARQLFVPIRRLEPGLYLLFFTLAGAAIRFNVLPELGVVGAVYLVARASTKVASAYLAGLVARLGRGESLRIGLDSLPHAGVSVGLAAVASAALPGHGIATITLGGIVIFETVGALVVRTQLRRAGRPIVDLLNVAVEA